MRWYIQHSAKGSTWEDHKYVKRIDGTYYYPNGYEDGHTINELSEVDTEALARETIKGSFGNGDIRKQLQGEHYQKIQNRVNQILRGSAGEISIDNKPETEKKIENGAKAVKKSTGLNMDKIYEVYLNNKERR